MAFPVFISRASTKFSPIKNLRFSPALSKRMTDGLSGSKLKVPFTLNSFILLKNIEILTYYMIYTLDKMYAFNSSSVSIPSQSAQGKTPLYSPTQSSEVSAVSPIGVAG